MYKQIICLLTAATFHGVAAPQESNVNARFYCNTTKIVFDALRKDYREEPMVYGRGATQESTIMSLWINPVTGTWTIVVSSADKTCVVAGGVDIKIVGDNGTSKSF